MFMAQENQSYYCHSFKSDIPGPTLRVFKKNTPHSLELFASGNMVSLVLFSNRWDSSQMESDSSGNKTSAGGLCAHSSTPGSPQRNLAFQLSSWFWSDLRERKIDEKFCLLTYLMKINDLAEARNYVQILCQRKVPHATQLLLHNRNPWKRNRQYVTAEEKASEWALIILRHQNRK